MTQYTAYGWTDRCTNIQGKSVLASPGVASSHCKYPSASHLIYTCIWKKIYKIFKKNMEKI